MVRVLAVGSAMGSLMGTTLWLMVWPTVWPTMWLGLMAGRALAVGRTGYCADGLILLLGLPWLIVHGAPVPEFAWRWLPVYVIAASLIFLLSVWLTAAAPMPYLRRVLGGMGQQTRQVHVRRMARALTTALYEELIWRVVCQSVLGLMLNGAVAIVVVATVFTFWHRRRTSGNGLLALELLLFSLVLGCLFYITADPLLIVTIHAVRNYLIGFSGYQSEKI